MGNYIGKPVLRREDARLLRGEAFYIADVRLPGMVDAAMLRSLYANARIKRVDLSRARQSPGVLAVFTHADLGRFLKPIPLLFPHPALKARMQLPLATDRVRYTGEIIAIVVARSRCEAEDACELIEVDYEPLPAVVDPRYAADPTSPPIHEDLGHNIAADIQIRFGDFAEASRRAHRVLRAEFAFGRCSGSPLETRGVIAEYRPESPGAKLTVWSSTQVPHRIRQALGVQLEMGLDEIRVLAPAVGGGFGSKAPFYVEENVVPFAAMRLGVPVRWIEDRREHLLAAAQEREQVHSVELAVDRDGRVLGIKDDLISDGGAYSNYGAKVAFLSGSKIVGPYKIANFEARVRMVYTNKAPVSPYRGAGRPQAIFVMERMLDVAARELGIDRAEIRYRNFIQPHEFPYVVDITERDGQVTYDSGNYPGNLSMALEKLGYEQAVQEAAEARRRGRAVGIGIGCMIENSGTGPFEGATVRVDPSGKVVVSTGATCQGQGQATTLAQICADTIGVDIDDVRVVMGDTAVIAMGVGSWGSRQTAIAGSAVQVAAGAVRQKIFQLAAEHLEAAAEDLQLSGGAVSVKGMPGRSVRLAELAWNAVGPYPGYPIPYKAKPGLEATEYFAPAKMVWSSAAHLVSVEVDRVTGLVRLLRYVAVHDSGRVINPLLVDGQAHGGIAAGIGNALFEQVLYDREGQLLTASFLDYLLPTAADMPVVEVHHMETPSPLNPLGAKGAGESGAMAAPAAICSAIEDALGGEVFINEFPVLPHRIVELLHARHRS